MPAYRRRRGRNEFRRCVGCRLRRNAGDNEGNRRRLATLAVLVPRRCHRFHHVMFISIYRRRQARPARCPGACHGRGASHRFGMMAWPAMAKNGRHALSTNRAIDVSAEYADKIKAIGA